MERKKKREKVVANGNVVDGTSGQFGDAHLWQREAEQQPGSAKKLASTSTSDSPTRHCPPPYNWSFPPHLPAPQPATHSLIPQSHVQAAPQQQVAATMQGPAEGGSQSLPPTSQLGWQNPGLLGQSTGPGHHQFQPGAGESNWPQAAPGGPTMGARPPPFSFPPPPYSGPWDPVSWWGHNPYQPPFPYLYPGFGGGYPCPMPPTPPIGTTQRGLIKPPPGLSQKHLRVWEAQSMENIQLWTTTTQLWAAVARADAEIALQRSKIIKLEADLQTVKAHRDGSVTHFEVNAALQSVAKRGRRKKALPGPVPAAVSLPALDSTTLRTPGRKARAITGKVDSAMKPKDAELLEEKDKSSLGNHTAELVYRPTTDDRDQESCSLTVGSLRNEIGSQKHPLRQTLEFQSSTNNLLSAAKDDLAFSQINHLNSPFKPSSLLAGRKDSTFEQSLKESVAVSFLKNAGNMDHQGVISGDMAFGATVNSLGMCPDTNGNAIAKDALVRSQLQAHFNVHNMEKANALNMQKANPTWQYTGADGSDEQDEGGASMQDDDDGDDVDDEDDETTLDDMHNEKVSNLWQSIPFR